MANTSFYMSGLVSVVCIIVVGIILWIYAQSASSTPSFLQPASGSYASENY